MHRVRGRAPSRAWWAGEHAWTGQVSGWDSREGCRLAPGGWGEDTQGHAHSAEAVALQQLPAHIRHCPQGTLPHSLFLISIKRTFWGVFLVGVSRGLQDPLPASLGRKKGSRPVCALQETMTSSYRQLGSPARITAEGCHDRSVSGGAPTALDIETVSLRPPKTLPF